MEFTQENFEKLLRVSSAADAWAEGRRCNDPAEFDLMIALVELNGDRPENLCQDCKGIECDADEGCAAYSVESMTSQLRIAKSKRVEELRQKYGSTPLPGWH